jgi:periplasmic divalent cation tolerance protein
MAADLIVVYVTAPSEEVGMLIANRLLEMRLAACVNIVPAVHSLYIWKGELTRDDEVLLICKTRADLFTDHFVPAVIEVHPNELPEIIALPIVTGSQNYMDWVRDMTISR